MPSHETLSVVQALGDADSTRNDQTIDYSYISGHRGAVSLFPSAVLFQAHGSLRTYLWLMLRLSPVVRSLCVLIGSCRQISFIFHLQHRRRAGQKTQPITDCDSDPEIFQLTFARVCST